MLLSAFIGLSIFTEALGLSLITEAWGFDAAMFVSVFSIPVTAALIVGILQRKALREDNYSVYWDNWIDNANL